MDLATMITRFKTALAGQADDESNAAITARLNAVYRYTIPDIVSGFLTDDHWSITTASGTTSYPFPDYVHSVRDGVQNEDGTLLTVWWEAARFLYEMGGEDVWAASSDKPSDIAFVVSDGVRAAFFYPNPDAAYEIWVPIRSYGKADLTSSGLTNHTHAQAVVAGAAFEYAEDDTLDEIAAKEGARFMRFVGQLRSRSMVMPQEPMRARTF